MSQQSFDDQATCATEAERRMETVANLLVDQANSRHSRKVLLSMFQMFASARRERAAYLRVNSNDAIRTTSWSEGYLTALAALIDLYLQARWKITGFTRDECDLVAERKTLTNLFHQ